MIVTVLMSILYLYVTEKTIPLFTVLVSLITLSFALLTILLHSPKILIFRDTFYDYFFAAAIFIGLYNKKYFLKKIFSHVVQLTDKGWRTASYAWGIYFLIMGTLNEIIREYGTEVLWINFKIWVVVATLGLSALLTLYLKEERIVK